MVNGILAAYERFGASGSGVSDVREHSIVIAPTGRLRAAINMGNPILAYRDSSTRLPAGVSVDLAHAYGQELGVGIDLIIFESAGESVAAVARDEADLGFFAVDPLRAQDIGFTSPYVLIEGCYLVAEASPLVSNAEVDRAGHVVVVGKGSAYDLFLTRTFDHAQLLRAPTSPSVVDTFLEHRADAAAGVRQQLEADARRIAGLRLLPGRFMVIQQAMGTPKVRGGGALTRLRAFVERMKSCGFVEAALRRHRIDGASVAPAGATDWRDES